MITSGAAVSSRRLAEKQKAYVSLDAVEATEDRGGWMTLWVHMEMQPLSGKAIGKR